MQKTTALCWVFFSLWLAGCEPGVTPEQQPSTTSATSAPSMDLAPEQEAFAAALGLKAYMDFSNAAQSAQQLDAQIAKLLHTPTAATLAQTQEAWRSAYDAYLHTLLYANLSLRDPVEWQKKGIGYAQTLTQLDSWPVVGGYIDHVPGYPFTGIVNDLALPLTPDNLLNQHGFSDPSYASIGFHVLEFMLWGEDGQRQASDFQARDNTRAVVDKNDNEPSHLNILVENRSTKQVQNQHRRRLFIQLVSDQLQKHLHRLQRRFEPSNGYYAELLRRATPNQVIQATLIATQHLISDEILTKRFIGNSSEFSRTSWADNFALLESIRQLYFPSVTSQPGLNSLLSTDSVLIAQWQQQLDSAQDCFKQWQNQLPTNQAAQAQCRQSLIELLLSLKHSATALNISLPNPN